MKKFFNILLLVLTVVPFSYSQEGIDIWTTTTTSIGRVYAMVIDQSNQSIMYAVGIDQGVNKTTNGGVNWSPVNNGILNTSVQTIAICKNSPQVLYAGTTAGTNDGVYKTTDGGASWTRVINGIAEPAASLGITAIMVHPDNPNIAWIAVFSSTADAVNGLYKTTDGGANWFVSNNGIGTIKNFISFAMAPTDPNTIYTGSSFQYPASIGPSVIYKSTDGGANWVLSSNGLPTAATDINPVRTMQVSSANPNVVIAGLFMNTANGGFYLSTDAGANWTKKQNGLPVDIGTLIRSSAIRPLFDNQFYIGLDGIDSLGVWATTNGGDNWFEFNGGTMLNTYTVRALVFNTTGNHTLFAGRSSATAGTGGVYEYTFSTVPTTFQLSVDIANGWNMVSIPGLHPTDQNVNTWWAFRDLGANVFKYAGGYQSVTTATPGTGYWMKHSGARTYNTGDEWPAGGIQIVPHAPITAASGWNLFGGYELSVTAANVTTNPPGLQSGQIYKYSGGYSTATTLDPGYGYWIKLTGAGQIIIPETLAKSEPVEYFPKQWGRIILRDATGVSYTLYGVKGQVDLSQYDLPPAPMEGMYDFRFSSGRIAEDLNSSVKTIDMSGVVYPLTVRVEGMDIRLMDETGNIINGNLKSGEDVVISDAMIQKLMVTSEQIPAAYTLEQNYPNPFNPNTKIKYTVLNSSQVTVKIFDALSNEIETLVNEFKPVGSYEVTWYAKNLPSGVYFYQLKAGKFIETKKMVLMK